MMTTITALGLLLAELWGLVSSSLHCNEVIKSAFLLTSDPTIPPGESDTM
jgi:hypothetical protein